MEKEERRTHNPTEREPLFWIGSKPILRPQSLVLDSSFSILNSPFFI
ncbi:MAG: hypothetical protein V2A79_19650 [Planctomycetota bacterium]